MIFSAVSMTSQVDTLFLCDPSDEVELQAPEGHNGYKWSPSSSLDNPTIHNPIAAPVWNTLYIAEMIGDDIGQNLISNPDFEGGNIGFDSEYPYSDRIFTQGLYGVASSAAELNGIYFTDCPDHTTGQGLMMVVDGSPFEGQKVWCQEVSVQPHTQYVFSTWLSSVRADNPAELQFSINEKPLGQIFTAVESVCQWRQFYELWQSEEATFAEICIINKNEDRNGNDFALDDFFFAKAEDITFDSTMVIIKEVDIGAEVSLLPDCGIDNGQISISPDGVNGHLSFAIDNGLYQDAAVFENIRAGEHQLSIIESTSALSEFNTCIYDTTIVVGQHPCPVYIPNVVMRKSSTNHLFQITPHPEFIGEFTSLMVVDRWGSLVFQSNDHEVISAGWDGRMENGQELSSGAYAYVLEVAYPDGHSQMINGELTLF